MPSINQVIERLDQVKPNTYDEQTKATWLYTLDGRISREIMDQDPPQKYRYPEDGDRELLVPFPFDEMYLFFMQAMIDYYNQEYGNYNNALMMHQGVFDAYAKLYQREHMPPSPGGFVNVM